MEIGQILEELATIQLKREVIEEALQHPLEVRFDPCPKCRHFTFHNVRLWVPNFEEGSLELFSTTEQRTHIHRLFQILDGRCRICKFDWWSVLCRIDPNGRIRQICNTPPLPRFNQLCEECLEMGVRGFFRGPHCTGGYCVACHNVFTTHAVSSEFKKRREQLIASLGSLELWRSRLIHLAENFDDMTEE